MHKTNLNDIDQYVRMGTTRVRVRGRVVALHEVAHALQALELGYDLELVRIGRHRDPEGHLVAGSILLTHESHARLDLNPLDSVKVSLAGPAAEFQEIRRLPGVDFDPYLRSQGQPGQPWSLDFEQVVVALRPDLADTELTVDLALEIVRMPLLEALEHHDDTRMTLLRSLRDELVRRASMNGEQFADEIEYQKGQR